MRGRARQCQDCAARLRLPGPEGGSCLDTLFAIGRDNRLNHRFAVTSGVLADECAGLLRAFFAKLRTAASKR